MVLAQSVVQFAESPFAPLAVGFFGLGTGYLIYGPEELFGFPRRSPRVDLATGIWGVWMPGFMQLLTGVWLFVGLTWFSSFTDPVLYAAALAFTAYGVHWLAIGMNRSLKADPRPNAGMCIAYALLSALGIVIFFKGSDAPVAGLFIGLTLIYISDFFASLLPAPPAPAAAAGEAAPAGPAQRRNPLGELGERGLGFFHLGTGLWLMYLTWATALNFSNGLNLPL